jgi:hypothetical protein
MEFIYAVACIVIKRYWRPLLAQHAIVRSASH